MCEKCIKSRKHQTDDILEMVDIIISLGKNKVTDAQDSSKVSKEKATDKNSCGELIPKSV
jgi:hypothetical protein